MFGAIISALSMINSGVIYRPTGIGLYSVDRHKIADRIEGDNQPLADLLRKMGIQALKDGRGEKSLAMLEEAQRMLKLNKRFGDLPTIQE